MNRIKIIIIGLIMIIASISVAAINKCYDIGFYNEFQGWEIDKERVTEDNTYNGTVEPIYEHREHWWNFFFVLFVIIFFILGVFFFIEGIMRKKRCNGTKNRN